MVETPLRTASVDVRTNQRFRGVFATVILFFSLLVFESLAIGLPTPYIDSFYTYTLASNAKDKINPRTVEGAMTPEMEDQFNNPGSGYYYERTSSFRADFANNYLAYQPLIAISKRLVDLFIDSHDATRIPLTLMLCYALSAGLLTILLYNLVPASERRHLFSILGTVLLLVFVMQVVLGPLPDERIYAPNIGVSILHAIHYLIAPPLGHSFFEWPTRSIAYLALAMLLPLVRIRRVAVYSLLCIPLLHAVCGIMLYPALLFWALTAGAPERKVRWGFILAYTIVISCFAAQYLLVFDLATIPPGVYIRAGVLGVIALALVVFLIRLCPRLRPRNIYLPLALVLFAEFLFFGLVYQFMLPKLGMWAREYFVQEFSGRSLDLLRCVLVAWIVDMVLCARDAPNRFQKLSNAVPVIKMASVLGMALYALTLSLPECLESFKTYQQDMAKHATITGYEDYIYSLAMSQ